MSRLGNLGKQFAVNAISVKVRRPTCVTPRRKALWLLLLPVAVCRVNDDD